MKKTLTLIVGVALLGMAPVLVHAQRDTMRLGEALGTQVIKGDTKAPTPPKAPGDAKLDALQTHEALKLGIKPAPAKSKN